MKQLMMLAGAATLLVAAPALARPGNGNGNGPGMGRGHGHDYAYGERGPVGYGVGGCPPGLRNKGCMPPGQARKLYRGQRYPFGYGSLYAYRSIPFDLRRRYGLSPSGRYYSHNGYLYRVNRRTMLVEQVLRR